MRKASRTGWPLLFLPGKNRNSHCVSVTHLLAAGFLSLGTQRLLPRLAAVGRGPGAEFQPVGCGGRRQESRPHTALVFFPSQAAFKMLASQRRAEPQEGGARVPEDRASANQATGFSVLITGGVCT